MQENRKEVRTVQEEMVRERKYWKRNQVWALILAAAVVLFGLLGGSGVSVAPGADALTMTMHDGTTESVASGDMTAAELLEEPDYGTVLEGKDTRAGKSGTWEHPQWGSYTLCTYASCTQAVRITAGDGCYVVNLPSEAETLQLYTLLQEKLPASR